MLLVCTYLSGAIAVLAEHEQRGCDESETLLEEVLQCDLGLDQLSCQHWHDTCQRLCAKYPLIKSIYEQAGVDMAAYLEHSERAAPRVVSLLEQHKNLSLLDLEQENIVFTRTMSEQQRAEFNAVYNAVGRRSRRQSQGLLYALIIATVTAVAVIGHHHGLWSLY